MKPNLFVLPLLLTLAACSVALENDARAKLKAQCEAKGMQFVETESKKTELIVVSRAQVMGECVGPGDPRYVQPTQQPGQTPSKT